MQITTNKGLFFLKCTSPACNDASYIAVLSTIAPKFVTAPVAVNLRAQLMITANYGKIMEPCTFGTEESRQLSRDYASLQKETMNGTICLVESGMPDFTPVEIFSRIDDVVSHPLLDAVKKLGDCSEAIEFLCSGKDKFKRIAKTLFSSGITPTVSHNDFFFSNVYKPPGLDGFMFFDWAEGFVSHPFLTHMGGLEEEEYLRQWFEYGSERDINTYFSLAQSLQSLVLILLRLEEARTGEEESLDCARDYLLEAHYNMKSLDCELSSK